jgi:hypothetical protein
MLMGNVRLRRLRRQVEWHRSILRELSLWYIISYTLHQLQRVLVSRVSCILEVQGSTPLPGDFAEAVVKKGETKLPRSCIFSTTTHKSGRTMPMFLIYSYFLHPQGKHFCTDKGGSIFHRSVGTHRQGKQ